MSREITPFESIRNSTDLLAIIKQEGKV